MFFVRGQKKSEVSLAFKAKWTAGEVKGTMEVPSFEPGEPFELVVATETRTAADLTARRALSECKAALREVLERFVSSFRVELGD